MEVSVYNEYKEVLRRIAKEAGVGQICSRHGSMSVLLIDDWHKRDLVSDLLKKYIPDRTFAVLSMEEDEDNMDILVFKMGDKYVWYNTEWVPDDMEIRMSKEEKAYYTRYGLF